MAKAGNLHRENVVGPPFSNNDVIKAVMSRLLTSFVDNGGAAASRPKLLLPRAKFHIIVSIKLNNHNP